MKRIVFLVFLSASAAWMQAQEVELKEVVVKGARVVQQADRQVIYPTQQQLESSTSGYSLLNKLALPHIRIDEPLHSITALAASGRVVVRINDTDASVADLLSMDMKAVERIDFIDHPGVRFGDDVAYVIDIKVLQPVSGYVVGADLTQALTTANGNGTVFGKWNMGKSELGVSCNAKYQHATGYRQHESATYLLNDGSLYHTERRLLSSTSSSKGYGIGLTYSLCDSAYVFQAKLNMSAPIGPSRSSDRRLFTEEGATTTFDNEGYSKSKSPSLDLYFHRDFRQHQSLTANFVATYIGSSSHTESNEGSAYAYDTRGKTYSLWAETVYENRLRPFNLSAGVQFGQRYMDNHYTGDADAHNSLHTSMLYGFGQLSGHLWQKLGYVAGFGLSRRYFSQDRHKHDFLLMRPKLSLSYPLTRRLRLKYDFEISQHVSQIALISSVSIKQNSRETLLGNPDIEPNRVTSHDLRLTYTTPTLMAELQGYYRLNDNCNMPKVTRTADNRFLTTQTNQKGCDFFFIQPLIRWTIIPEKVDFTAYCGLYRFFNYGDDYTHTYTSANGAAWLQAYLGRWTITAYGDNGWNWMEGENEGHQGANWQMSASYRLSRSLTLSAYAGYLFCAHPTGMRSELKNRYIKKSYASTDSDAGNSLTLNLTWHFAHGRKYRDINRTLNHKDTETGDRKSVV